uniref:Uncharacterized protein n=1 Tax=Rhizophora mucronata TaxID=61149 RepID=A0A2P2Q0C6_RHIMU
MAQSNFIFVNQVIHSALYNITYRFLY